MDMDIYTNFNIIHIFKENNLLKHELAEKLTDTFPGRSTVIGSD